MQKAKQWGWLVLAVSLIPSVVLAQNGGIRPVRVYVFTAVSESGFIDADSKGRADSVADILKYLPKKKKTIVVVKDRETAEVLLEVKGRNMVLTGSTSIGTDPVFGGVKNRADRTGTLHTTLTLGDYSTEIVGRGGQLGRVWAIAAWDVIGEVDKWLKDNGARIPRK